MTGAGYTVSVGPLLVCVSRDATGQPLGARAVHVEAPWHDSQQGDAGRHLDDVIDGSLRSPGEYPFALSDQHSSYVRPLARWRPRDGTQGSDVATLRARLL